ncbi:MAG TPA: SemiSWEET transporter [Candidatus Nanoarchaeia archaeon]|nr:SemiSWEET transporter [Candidatus Nanoarchaeia archaeon]
MEIVTIIGLVAAALTTWSFLPQVIKTIRTKKTEDISLAMFLVLSVGLFIWLVYGLLIKDLPLIIANLISFILTAIILFFKIKYH